MGKKKIKIDKKLWMHAICHLSVVPVRTRPDQDDPQVSQMLFGELCYIREKKNKHWYKISTLDDVDGWVQTTQINVIENKTFEELRLRSSIALEIAHPVFHDETAQVIVLGSFLPKYDGMSLHMPEGKLIYNGMAKGDDTEITLETFIKIARRYLYAPELKGGKSPFGIDNAAFVQLVFRYVNISLPRYASQQANLGQAIDFVDFAEKGDLVFCANDDNQIDHVGIYLGEKNIIHVNGCVRIDRLDHHGIYNTDSQKYTHKLRIIKRLLTEQNFISSTQI